MNPSPGRRPLTRRHLLRGTGALLGLPFLETLAARDARAQGAAAPAGPPLRMGIVTVTGGTVIESWRLPAPGPLQKLPSILRPLEFARGDLLLLGNLSQSGRSENLNAHEHCGYLHLTCADSVRKEGGKSVAGISVDQVAAAAQADRTLLPSLEFGLSNHETRYSFRSPTEPVPYEADPRVVFERMFRGRKPAAPNWSRRMAAAPAAPAPAAARPSYERSVVDTVLEEARALRKDLGRADQRRLDEYVEAVRAVEKRIGFLEARVAEDLPDAGSPRSATLIQPRLPAADIPWWKVANDIQRDPEVHAEYIRVTSDLMVLAFQTDTTRVITMAVGSDEAMFPGVVTVGYERHCHTLEHQGNAAPVENADPIAREACRQIHAWYTALFAEMVAKMKAVDEGGSSLLDNCMLLYTSYMADGGHGRNDYPAVLVGKAQGTLKPGRQLVFRKDTPVANLYVEMLNRMGVRTDRFGDSHTSRNAAYNGRLPDLT